MARGPVGGGEDAGGGASGVLAFARPARLLVAAFLALAAAATAWYGASLATFDFTRPAPDSPYLLIGLGPLLVGIAATVAAWLIIREEVVGWHRAARALFAVVIFALPIALGVGNSVYQEVLRPTSPYRGSSLGYTFDIPRAYWTFLPAERDDVADESIVFMNWTAFTPEAPVPAGGLRVRIGPHEDGSAAGEPFAVGKGRYPGTILRSDAPTGGEPYRIIIVYAANGRAWRIVGDFAEAPDAANPNTARFFTIVGSLRHER